MIYRKDNNVKLFANDTSLFSIINCLKVSASVLNSDFIKIQDWVLALEDVV